MNPRGVHGAPPPQAGELRAFLAHRRDDGDEQINEWIVDVQRALAEGYAGPVVVVAGRDDFRARVPVRRDGKAGRSSWSGWERDVALGTRQDGTPRYHGFVMTSPLIGKATAEIVSLALRASKPVLLLRRRSFAGELKSSEVRSAFVAVVDVRERLADGQPDARSWKDGWLVITSPTSPRGSQVGGG